jgi:hypothetical protein
MLMSFIESRMFKTAGHGSVFAGTSSLAVQVLSARKRNAPTVRVD